jgi:hypothetical protein
MAALTEGKYSGEFILSEAKGGRSRDNVVVLSGQNLKAGRVLGRRLVARDVRRRGGTRDEHRQRRLRRRDDGHQQRCASGVYRIVITEPGANVGSFEVFGPDGLVVGDGVVGTLFDNEIQFTLADGATDFVSTDAFTVAVTAGTYKYLEYNPANVDGSQRVAGILYGNVDASAADKNGVALQRDAEVRSADLTWFSGATQAQKDVAADALAALGIIVRL